MVLSANETYLLELINRARLDPAAEALRYDLALDADLAPGAITATAKQALAPNVLLEQAAEDHSIWMLQADVFSHTGSGDSNPGDRIKAAGYSFAGGGVWRENLAWAGNTRSVDLAAAIDTHHEGLYRSEGHRLNTFANDIREIGIAQVRGDFTHQGNVYDASMVTLNTARAGSQVFVTGVAYEDSDSDGFYDIGEGTGGALFESGAASTTTADAGSYALKLTPGSDVTVNVGADTVVRIDLGSENVKLDLVTNGAEAELFLSGSATLVEGIATARLLGIADLDLTGSDVDNILTGNRGDNVLRGGAGDDRLQGGDGNDALYGEDGVDVLDGGSGRREAWGALDETETGSNNDDFLAGGAGNDVLNGRAGRDQLDGGAGDDVLTGGGGRDTFVFNGGADRITDFTTHVDQLELDAQALGEAGLTVAEAMDRAQVSGGEVIFDFGADRLVLSGVEDLEALANDLVIV